MVSTLLLLALQASSETVWEETRFHRVHLANGNFIDGQWVQETPRLVVLKMKSGTFSVRKDMINRVEYVKMRSLKETPPPVEERPKEESATAQKPPKPAVAAAPPALPAFPAAAIRTVDDLITRWRSFPEDLRTDHLLARIPEEGSDATAYACWRVGQRTPGTPVKELVGILGEKDHPAVLPMMRAVAQSGMADERTALVAPLEAKGNPEALDLLCRLLDDPSAGVWRPASEALIRIARKESSREVTDRLTAALAAAQEKAPLAITIAQLGEADGRRALLELLRMDEEPVTRAALQGLAIYADPADGEVGRGLLSHRSDALKKDACAFLGQIKYMPAVPDLIPLLEHENPSVSQDAYWALQQTSGQRYRPDAALWKQWWETSGRAER